MSTETKWTELDEFTSATLAALVDETLGRLKDAAATPTWTIPGNCDPGMEDINENNKLDRNAGQQRVLHQIRELLSNHRIGYSLEAPDAEFEAHAVPIADGCLQVSLGHEQTAWAE